MALQTLQNFYKATVAVSAWGTGTGTVYVSTSPTPTAGRLVVNPASATGREIVSYTSRGTDGNGNYVVLSARGVGGTTAQAHSVNEPVRMNIVAEHYSDIQTEIDTKLDASYLDTDGTLAANSDVKVASQKATKTYADTKVSLTGNETVAGVKTFSSSPVVPAPTTDLQAATKKYVDDTAFAGAPDASTTVKGIVEEATEAEVIAGTTEGGTSARLFVNPGTMAGWLNSSVVVNVSSGTVYSLTTTADERVVVIAKGRRNFGAGASVSLQYNTVEKDNTGEISASGVATLRAPFTLMYSETPGAGTANVHIVGSDIDEAKIFVLKLKK